MCRMLLTNLSIKVISEFGRWMIKFLLLERIEAQTLCLLFLGKILGVLGYLIAAHHMVRDYWFLHDAL